MQPIQGIAMPEISDAELRQFVRYQNLGTPEEVERKIADLVKDNGKQRDELRESADKLKALPPEGAVVLTGAEAKLWPTLKELGKPEEIQAKLAAGQEAQSKLAEREKRDRLAEAASALGWQGSLTARIRGIEAGTIEIREESVTAADGTTSKVKVPYITPAGEGAQAVKLTDYAAQHDPELVPLLPAKQEEPAPTRGAPFVPQSPGGKPAGAYDPVQAGKDMAAANKAGDNSLAFR